LVRALVQFPVASLTPATAAFMRSTFERPLAGVCDHHALDLASLRSALSVSVTRNMPPNALEP